MSWFFVELYDDIKRFNSIDDHHNIVVICSMYLMIMYWACWILFEPHPFSIEVEFDSFSKFYALHSALVLRISTTEIYLTVWKTIFWHSSPFHLKIDHHKSSLLQRGIIIKAATSNDIFRFNGVWHVWIRLCPLNMMY